MNTLQPLVNRLNNAHKALLVETDAEVIQEILKDIATLSEQIAKKAKASLS